MGAASEAWCCVKVAILLVALHTPVGFDGPTKLPLGDLRSDCQIVRRWAGIVPTRRHAAWLECGDHAVLVTGPLSVVRHVDIRTPDSALDYVRFFTSSETYDLFDLGGAVEVMPTVDKRERAFNELDRPLFTRHLQKARVRTLRETDTPNRGPYELGRGRLFEIRRPVLLPDQTVREYVESVSQDGFYNLVSKEVIIKDANDIGLLYFWPQ